MRTVEHRCEGEYHILAEGSSNASFRLCDNTSEGEDEMSSIAGIPFVLINFSTFLTCSLRIMFPFLYIFWSFATIIHVSTPATV